MHACCAGPVHLLLCRLPRWAVAVWQNAPRPVRKTTSTRKLLLLVASPIPQPPLSCRTMLNALKFWKRA